MNCKQKALDYVKKPKRYWNYRVVAEYDKKWKVWQFSIRGVHYENEKITAWDADEQRMITDCDVNDLYLDLQHMEQAFQKKLVVVNGDNHIEVGGISITKKPWYTVTIKPEQLKKYEKGLQEISD